MPVSGSNAAPVQFGPADRARAAESCPFLSFGPGPTTDGGVNIGPVTYLLHDLERLGPQLRREVDQVVDGDALPIERRRLGRKRLRRRRLLAGHRGGRHRLLDNRPHRLAGHAIEHIGERLLRHLDDRLDRLAVDGDVDQNRRRRIVVVQQIVVHGLEVPDALAGLRVQTDHARRCRGCRRDDGRRTCRWWRPTSAGRRSRAPRPRSSATTRCRRRCTRNEFALPRLHTAAHPRAEWCGTSTCAVPCARRTRARRRAVPSFCVAESWSGIDAPMST